MIDIDINGRSESIDEGLSLEALLEQLGFGGKRVAVELNREIVPRSQHAETWLQDGDRIEIVHAIGGG